MLDETLYWTGAHYWDFPVEGYEIRESLNLQFRAKFFNFAEPRKTQLA